MFEVAFKPDAVHQYNRSNLYWREKPSRLPDRRLLNSDEVGMKKFFLIVLFSFLYSPETVCFAEDKIYIGSEACKDCHEQEYENFKKFAKKAKSFESIKKMEKKLTPGEYKICFECHTTGYGKKGGFISEEKTPGLKNAGCEVCHGPGSLHADSEDPDLIEREISLEDCTICHNEDRVESFDFKPLLFGGAH